MDSTIWQFALDNLATVSNTVLLLFFFISVTESISSSIDSPSSPESEAWFQHWENLKRIVKNPIFHEIIQNLDIVSAQLNLSVNLEKWQMTFIGLEFLVDFWNFCPSAVAQMIHTRLRGSWSSLKERLSALTIAKLTYDGVDVEVREVGYKVVPVTLSWPVQLEQKPFDLQKIFDDAVLWGWMLSTQIVHCCTCLSLDMMLRLRLDEQYTERKIKTKIIYMGS